MRAVPPAARSVLTAIKTINWTVFCQTVMVCNVAQSGAVLGASTAIALHSLCVIPQFMQQNRTRSPIVRGDQASESAKITGYKLAINSVEHVVVLQDRPKQCLLDLHGDQGSASLHRSKPLIRIEISGFASVRRRRYIDRRNLCFALTLRQSERAVLAHVAECHRVSQPRAPQT
jgi:hypothetical protein